MGTVYLAVDQDLGREVAIKIPNTLASSGLERRLQIECRVLAALEHPGIVPIHDAGRLADGRLFYVMKRVRGRTLREQIRDVSDPIERLRVFERICEPVAFAHAQGFIHRDLKPDNVMVGAFGEVMVMDWGAAKALTVAARASQGTSPESSVTLANQARPSHEPDSTTAGPGSITDEGAVIGTRGFMAPEQARGAGDDREIDQRADVYGLGAILFLLLTDETPVLDLDPGASLRKHGVPRPLAAICTRALALDPADRYQDVTALAADVTRYRAGRPVEAYPETVLDRLARFGRTYRTAIFLVLAYIIMRALVAVLAGW
jgi:serine/threonine protein kinase